MAFLECVVKVFILRKTRQRAINMCMVLAVALVVLFTKTSPVTYVIGETCYIHTHTYYIYVLKLP